MRAKKVARLQAEEEQLAEQNAQRRANWHNAKIEFLKSGDIDKLVDDAKRFMDGEPFSYGWAYPHTRIVAEMAQVVAGRLIAEHLETEVVR